jgi:hypothetical protein
MADKQLYQGRFNFFGEVHELWRWASSPKQAKQLMLRELAKKVGYLVPFVRVYFNGSKDNFTVTQTTKLDEEEANGTEE